MQAKEGLSFFANPSHHPATRRFQSEGGDQNHVSSYVSTHYIILDCLLCVMEEEGLDMMMMAMDHEDNVDIDGEWRKEEGAMHFIT